MLADLRGTLASIVCAAALLGLPPGAEGAERPFNWAYAAAYGTGTYELGEGSKVTVLRLPLYLTLRKPNSGAGCACGVRLLFPVTIGVENFDFHDLRGLPERTNEFAFFPGVEVELPRTQHWTLKLRGQVGQALQTGGERLRTRLYGAGIRSRYAWPKRFGRPALITGLYWSAFETDVSETEQLARFSAGVELDLDVPRWKFNNAVMHLMPHVLVDWYFQPIEIGSIVTGEKTSLTREWEIGLAAGRDQGFSVLGAKFDRVGVAFRRSKHSRGIRFYLASIF